MTNALADAATRILAMRPADALDIVLVAALLYGLLYAVRGTYNFSKRTAIYATAGFIDNGGQLAQSVSSNPGASASPGGTQLGAMLGVKHIF